MSFDSCNFPLKIWDSNSQSGNPFGNVWVHSLTLSYTLGSMKCDSQASLLARTFVSPYLGCEPKVRVMTHVIYMHSIHVCIGSYLSSPNPPNYEHFFSHIPRIPKQEFKIFIIISETLPPFSIDAIVPKNVHIMVRSQIAKIHVNKQVFVVKNNCVIHNIKKIAAIELSLVTWILPRFPNFNQGPINELNASWQLLQIGPQCSSFLGCKPTNLIHKCKINAR